MTLISFATWYAYAGMIIALGFTVFALSFMDENASGAWIFRPLIVPGVILIWPLVLWRCLVLWRGEEKLARHRMPRRAQEYASLAFAIVIPVILIVAFAARQDPGQLAPPVLIEAAK